MIQLSSFVLLFYKNSVSYRLVLYCSACFKDHFSLVNRFARFHSICSLIKLLHIFLFRTKLYPEKSHPKQLMINGINSMWLITSLSSDSFCSEGDISFLQRGTCIHLICLQFPQVPTGVPLLPSISPFCTYCTSSNHSRPSLPK